MIRCQFVIRCHAVGLSVMVVACLLSDTIIGQEQPADATATKPAIVAWVNEKPILDSRVATHLNTTLGNRKLSGHAKMMVQAGAVEHLINRRIVFDYLVRNEFGPSADLVQIEVESLENKLQTVNRTLGQHLAATNQSREQLEFEIKWKLAWAAYLKRYLTEDNTQRFFESHRRKYDGTEMQVAHLLLKPAAGRDVLSRAKKIKKQLDSKELSWEAAVKKFSDAPSRDTAGIVGWIKYSGPMPADFNQAAFGLEKNQVSEPVQTSFGIHLIQCMEIQPGSISWQSVKQDVANDASGFLFEKLASKHRSQVAVEYAKSFPHFDKDANGKSVLVKPAKQNAVN